jgi:hypothetical protein
MSGASKTMAATTLTALVVVTAYSCVLGGSGWLWFGWVVLVVVTLGMLVTGRGD